jgi:hypothetical protein
MNGKERWHYEYKWCKQMQGVCSHCPIADGCARKHKIDRKDVPVYQQHHFIPFAHGKLNYEEDQKSSGERY